MKHSGKLWWRFAAAVWLSGAALSLASEMKVPDYSAAIAQLEGAVREEMTTWEITGVALALVDGQQTVYAGGFGEARRDSVFRCGSISKLFTATAVMQLVEAGRLDLDAPVERCGTGLLPVDPFTNGTPVTLRQLLCHRSGMIRESLVGGYFDDSEPGLERTIASVAQTALVNPPNTKTRYSNVGPSIAGRALELVTGANFEQYQRAHILDPLEMSSSAWTLANVPRGRLVPAFLRVADGNGGFQRRRTPVFDLGTIPAGNLFTTAEDLGQFLKMLAADGMGSRGRVLKSSSLAEMFRPQLTSDPTGFGLGFMVGRFRHHTAVSHNGAVYGHSSALVFLPEKKIGVVVLGNEDIVNARIEKLAHLALSLMLEAKLGEKPPAPPARVELSPEALAALAGDYESQSFWAKLEAAPGRLKAVISGQPARLTAVGPWRFVADSRSHNATPMVFERNDAGEVTGFTLGLQQFTRVRPGAATVPREWRAYLGSYGPSFIPLIISERYGHLYAMTENLADYRLTPLNRHVFAFPPGLYTDEHLVLLTDRRGKPNRVSLANMVLPRR